MPNANDMIFSHLVIEYVFEPCFFKTIWQYVLSGKSIHIFSVIFIQGIFPKTQRCWETGGWSLHSFLHLHQGGFRNFLSGKEILDSHSGTGSEHSLRSVTNHREKMRSDSDERTAVAKANRGVACRVLGIEQPLLLSCSVLSDSLRCHFTTAALQASLSPRICSNSCPLSRLCHVTLLPSVAPFSFCPQSFPASGSFPVSQLFTSGGQSIGTLASVLPMNIQGWFPLGLTGLISLQSKRPSRVFSNTTVQKRKFFGVQPSLWSNSHIHTWLLKKP